MSTTTSSFVDETTDGSGSSTEVMRAVDQYHDSGRGDFNVLLGVTHSKSWGWFIAVLTLISLFLSDIALITFPISLDIVVNVIYIAIGVVFLAEFLVMCIWQEKYVLRYFFFADLFAIVSLIPDMIPLTEYGKQPEGSTDVLDKFVAAVRILRLFRLWRMFRIMDLIEVYAANKKHGQTTAAYFGRGFATYMGAKLGTGIIFLTIIVSLLSFDYPYIGPGMGLAMLDRLPIHSFDFNQTLILLVESYPVVLVEIGGIEVYFDAEEDDISDYRAIELEDFTSENGFLQVDVSEVVINDAVFNIVMILVIMLLFALGTFIIHNDTKNKIIKPSVKIFNAIGLLAEELDATVDSDNQFSNPDDYAIEQLGSIRAVVINALEENDDRGKKNKNKNKKKNKKRR
eukprot:TRINITY_DN12366_c0_g1_i1.p1 TRINITY_DN12366_c0_g1~~TRINITY_DN12366_c0_g1_i1.p1  ORF type:complete len:399 (-),score=78.86 TRINITY_DN12366_c0_g1_i1:72-1268(-)